MSDVFREVDEDVRRDQLTRLWRTYGPYVIAVALAVVLGVAANVGWKEYRLSQRLADGERFAAALDLLDGGHSALAAQRFAELAEDAGDGYVVLARLREVEALTATGDTDGAVAVLDRLAADDGIDSVFRDLARLRAALYLIDSAPADELDRRLAPLMGDDSPWRASARELDGLVAMRNGETARAREIFTDLSEDASAPPALRGRAAELLAALGGRTGGGG
ncbi:MAG: tetratricopeptide repeat protein [Alphaproteobacteria bacterium]